MTYHTCKFRTPQTHLRILNYLILKQYKIQAHERATPRHDNTQVLLQDNYFFWSQSDDWRISSILLTKFEITLFIIVIPTFYDYQELWSIFP